MTEILFESNRLYFREPCENDIETLYHAAREVWPELRRWMCWTSMEEYSLKNAREFVVDFTIDQRNKGGCWMFAFNKETDDLVVSTGLAAFNRAGIYDTGYWVAKNYLGQGYATEATLAVLKYGFEIHGADVIKLSYFEGNEKSRNIIKKCGFDFVETLPKAHKCFADGQMMDEHCYAITSNRWRNMAARAHNKRLIKLIIPLFLRVQYGAVHGLPAFPRQKI